MFYFAADSEHPVLTREKRLARVTATTGRVRRKDTSRTTIATAGRDDVRPRQRRFLFSLFFLFLCRKQAFFLPNENWGIWDTPRSLRWHRWGFYMIAAIAFQISTGYLRQKALEGKHSNFSLFNRVSVWYRCWYPAIHCHSLFVIIGDIHYGVVSEL